MDNTDGLNRLWQKYLEALGDEQKDNGSDAGTGIEIVTEPEALARVEADLCEYAKENGLPTSWAKLGIVYESRFHRIIQDSVRFPGGRLGTYLRVQSKPLTGNTVAMLPLYEGKIVLVHHFRHGIRDWSLEIPRGNPIPGLSDEEVAQKELKEEIAAEVTGLTPLGRMHADGGILARTVSLFLAEVTKIGQVQTEDAIDGIELLSPGEMEARMDAGDITDSYTLVAFPKARARGLL